MRKLVSVLLSLGLASIAQAADWMPVTNPNGQETTNFFIDRASVKNVAPLIHVWWKFTPTPRSVRGEAGNSAKYVAYTLVRSVFNCYADVAQTERKVVYFDDGSSNVVEAPSLSQDWEPVAAGSITDVLMKTACAIK
jgi:hypothetical protein